MKLARINTFLLIAIIVVNGYVILLPIIPSILFSVQSQRGTQRDVLKQAIHKSTAEATPQNNANRLIIPSMLLDEEVHEGNNASTLKKGLWRRPQTSTPDKSGNTVIVGHRLTYSDPRGTLYHLDKVRTGDELGLHWNNKNYLYRVTETKIVKDSEIAVEAPTDSPRLTIYTCTPLWLPKDRLVVIAELDRVL